MHILFASNLLILQSIPHTALKCSSKVKTIYHKAILSSEPWCGSARMIDKSPKSYFLAMGDLEYFCLPHLASYTGTSVKNAYFLHVHNQGSDQLLICCVN